MNTSYEENIRRQAEADPATLEREIDRQRDHINELVNALTSKLGGNFAGGDLMNQLGSTIKANPLPSLVTLAGLAWLYSSRDKPIEETNRHVHVGTEGMGASAHGMSSAYDTGSGAGAGSNGGGRMQHLREGASERLGHAKQATRERAHRASESYHHLLENNPLAAGAIGVAVGALLGALLPATRKEDELLGATSARFKESARELARSGYQKAAEAGREVTSRPSPDGAHAGQHSPTSTMGPTPIQSQPS